MNLPSSGDEISMAAEGIPTTGLYSEAVAPREEASWGKNGLKMEKVKPRQMLRNDREMRARRFMVFSKQLLLYGLYWNVETVVVPVQV